MTALGSRLAAIFARPSPLRGMLFMAGAVFSAAAMNACARFVSAELHPFEIAFFRGLLGLLVLSPLLLRGGFKALKVERYDLHFARGVLQTASMLQFFAALALTELATVAALQFSTPLFAALLAVVFLREVMNRPRAVALVVGLIGTLVILRPGEGGLHWGGILVLGASLSWAGAIVVTKALVRSQSSATITLYATLFTIPGTLAFAIPVWQMPSLAHWPWLLAIALFGTGHNLAIAQACKEADVTAIEPLEFTKLVWAALFGFALFTEIPSVWTWIGGAVIFSASTYNALSERRVAAAPRAGGPDRRP